MVKVKRLMPTIKVIKLKLIEEINIGLFFYGCIIFIIAKK